MLSSERPLAQVPIIAAYHAAPVVALHKGAMEDGRQR
jgi:hypothetical protein